MNRGLMTALAVVLAAVAWLQGQGDDDGLSVARRPGSGHPAAEGGATAASHGPSARSGAAAATDATGGRAGRGNAAAWAELTLTQGVPAWQRRHAAPQAGDTADASAAWALATPPAPPVLRQPPPAETIVVAPPAPTAPRFPHAWVGRFNDGAVVSGADTTWVVRPGDVIEGQWRVDRLDDRRMSLTYLPLNLPQQVVMR